MKPFSTAGFLVALAVAAVGAQVPAAPAALPAPPPPARTFSATTGLLFNTVRPDRVADFEKVMGFLEAALRSSPDPARRAQAEGWRIFRASEPGPNGTVLYVYVLSPAVPGADYGLGRILADAYPDQVQEIWKLYQSSVTGGGSLLNLNPLVPSPPAPAGTPSPTSAPASTPTPTPVPAPIPATPAR